VERGHQGRTLTTGGNVSASKVSDHIYPAELGQQGRRVDLDGVADPVEIAGPVPDRLSVAADGDHSLRRQACFGKQRLDDPGVASRQPVARERNPMGRMTTVEDVAQAIVTLSESGTHWLTGNVLGVDGGELISG
jgi:hypothetical protein